MKQTTLNREARGNCRVKNTVAIIDPINKKSARQFTFTELWAMLAKNYERNRRDLHFAYGGHLFYRKVHTLYRLGTDDLSGTVTPGNTAMNNPPHESLP